MKKSFWIVWIVLFLGLCSCKKNNSNEIILSFDEAYYQPLNGPLDQTFKEKLHTLLEQTHTHQGTYAEVWEILKKADADSNQTDHIVCLYTGQSIPIANQDQGLSGNYLWNREHLWPKAKGFKSEKMPAHNDCHHLHASEKTSTKRGQIWISEMFRILLKAMRSEIAGINCISNRGMKSKAILPEVCFTWWFAMMAIHVIGASWIWNL